MFARAAVAASAAMLSGCTTTPPARMQMSASPAEIGAIGAALSDVYAVISGPAGQPRDWARMRTLFTPGARLTAIGSKGLNSASVDEYIARSGPVLIEHGFTERELARRVEVYGNLAHAWSSYEGIGDGGKMKVRGINSFQLVRQSDGRWLVQSILWQQENKNFPLPADMVR
jgi:hypothetical protein